VAAGESPMKPRASLGDLQLAIMRVLWERGEAAATEVHAALLAERGLAPTTIATMLTKMEKKGVVRHRAEGRRFVYRPAVSESEVTRNMVAQLADRLFDGSTSALANHLIAEHEIDPEELDRLRRLLEEREGES
jgi:BlaI family transcriptional regulator, penicillinase repressor